MRGGEAGSGSLGSRHGLGLRGFGAFIFLMGVTMLTSLPLFLNEASCVWHGLFWEHLIRLMYRSSQNMAD